MAQVYIVSCTDLSKGIHTSYMKVRTLGEAQCIARSNLRVKEIQHVEIFDIEEDLSSNVSTSKE